EPDCLCGVARVLGAIGYFGAWKLSVHDHFSARLGSQGAVRLREQGCREAQAQGVARGSASDDLRDSAVNGSRPGTPLSRTSSFARTSSRRRAPAAGPQAGRPTLRSALRDSIAGLEAGEPLIPEVGVAEAGILGIDHLVQTALHRDTVEANEPDCL